MTVAVLNTDAGLSGKTLVNEEDTQTITGAKTFDRDPSAPFAVSSGSAVVTNLDADKVDGQDGSYYLNASNLASGTVPTARLGSGSASASNFLRGDQSWASAGQVSLLKAGSGTDTSAGATNVDTIAITGLTVLDRIEIHYTVESITQDTANPLIYHQTDGATICTLLGGNACTTATALVSGEVSIQTAQSSSSRYIGQSRDLNAANSSRTNLTDAARATAFTGSWTLALRHGGVTAGGTFKWTWKVFKIAGQ